MICTSMIPCLSSVMAKNNETMSMFVLFSRIFGHFENLAFLENRATNLTPKQSNRTVLVFFSKVRQLSKNFQESVTI